MGLIFLKFIKDNSESEEYWYNFEQMILDYSIKYLRV